MTLWNWFKPPIWWSHIYLVVIIYAAIQERLLVCLVQVLYRLHELASMLR